MQEFGRAIQGADVALFYYAGHGMQVDGSNWLVPTDANPTRPQDLEFQMVNAELVLKQMDGGGNPAEHGDPGCLPQQSVRRARHPRGGGGLAQMQAPEGTMISFATQPGNVAADGSGADGPFATGAGGRDAAAGARHFRVFNRVGCG